jgi:large subunit ribosomal protein L21
MFAVIRTGGKQYKVSPDEVIAIEKVVGEAGDVVRFEDVLMVGGDEIQLAASDVAVTATVLEQKRDDKILVFKKRRRHNYRRTIGHRQYLTVVRIGEISVAGAVPEAKSKRAKSRPAEDDAAAASAEQA